MKKFIALAVAVVVLAVLAVPAFAALDSSQGGTEVTYVNNEAYTYTITVPEEVFINGGAAAIIISDYSLPNAFNLSVALDTNGGNITDVATDVVTPNAFAIELNGSSEISLVTFNGPEQSATVKAVSTQNTPTEPGDYVGYVTYTVEVVEKAA